MGSLYSAHFFSGMPSMASVSTAGTTLARSSTKSIRPSSIFSSMLARTTSPMNGSQRLTAAGDRYGFKAVRYQRCSGASISSMPPRIGTSRWGMVIP